MKTFKTNGHYGSSIIDCDAIITTDVDLANVPAEYVILKQFGRKTTSVPGCIDCGTVLKEFDDRKDYFHPLRGIEFYSDEERLCICDKCASYRIMVGQATYVSHKMSRILAELMASDSLNETLRAEIESVLIGKFF